MNRTYIQTRNKTTTCTAWSAWSAWSSAWKGPPTYRVWRSRTRRCTETWQERSVRESCRRMPSIPFTEYWWSSFNIGPWVNRSNSWTETEWESDWWEPPDRLPDWHVCIAGNILRGDRFRAQLNWLKNIPEVRAYRAFFDGDRYRHGEVVRTDVLRPGTHVMQVEVDLKGGGSREFEVSFNVIDRLELRIDQPVRPLSVGGRGTRNGCAFKVRITNHSSDTMPAALEAVSVPSGWKAGFVGGGIITLPPRGTKTVALLVEMMNELGITEDGVVPVTIGAAAGVGYSPRTGWSLNHPAFATAYINLTTGFDRNTKLRIVRTNRALARQDREKVFQMRARGRR